jgi:hypothetical protein
MHTAPPTDLKLNFVGGWRGSRKSTKVNPKTAKSRKHPVPEKNLHLCKIFRFSSKLMKKFSDLGGGVWEVFENQPNIWEGGVF